MKYIWLKEEKNHQYAEFKTNFYYSGEGTPLLKITSDYKFAAYVNGNFAANGQFADVPEYKTFSVYDLTYSVRRGDNELTIKAYHSGEGFSVCRPMTACVAFVLTEGERVMAESDERCFARESSEYERGDICTPQYGYLYNYSFVKEENAWKKAREVTPDFKEFAKPVRNTRITPPVRAKVSAQGEFRWRGGETLGEKMQKAWLSPLFFNEATGENKCLADGMDKPLDFCAKDKSCDGVYALFDLGAERAGYPYLEVETETPQTVYLGYGEHLEDLRPRTFVGGRNFCIEIKLKKGKNEFSDYLRRIGARYYMLFAESEKIKVNDIGIREEIYPFVKPKKDFGDRLFNALYETGRRTLELCAHEHYEDCPWREQALYGMDSRNQMLFGYGAFGEYDYPRANLKLMSECVEEDGLLTLCSPACVDIKIPSFSLYFAIAFAENAERDYNAEFVSDVLPSVKRLMKTFMNACGETGALYTLGGKRYWNFHEWSEGLDGGTIRKEEDTRPVPDCILTALGVIAADKLCRLLKRTGDIVAAKEYAEFSAKLLGGLMNFYEEGRGLFASYIESGEKKGFHEYTQAAVLLAAGKKLDKTVKANLVSALENGKENLVKITLAGLPVKYEALLKYAGRGAKEYVIEDCTEIFGKMLLSGATSFWETEKGAADFDEAGSLCHGWSSVVCYVLDTAVKNRTRG